MCRHLRSGVAAAPLPYFIAVAALWSMSCASALAADDFYAGKQITIIVGAGVGGGYDLQARMVARHLPKHIPGKPNVIVQNMPARIPAANHMFSTAPTDGTMIALLQRGVLLATPIYPTGLRYESQKFHWLASVNHEA